MVEFSFDISRARQWPIFRKRCPSTRKSLLPIPNDVVGHLLNVTCSKGHRLFSEGNLCYEILSPENLVKKTAHPMYILVAYLHKDTPRIRKQPLRHNEPIA